MYQEEGDIDDVIYNPKNKPDDDCAAVTTSNIYTSQGQSGAPYLINF